MFNWEKDAETIIDIAMDKYEEHFKESFPLYEYLELTQNDEYDFSLRGSKRLSDFIDDRIRDNKPVAIPEGYEERLY